MSNLEEYPISDLANIFPELPRDDYARLVASIREQGLVDPIAVCRGEVIDGRHRYAACAEAGSSVGSSFYRKARTGSAMSWPRTACDGIWTRAYGLSSPAGSPYGRILAVRDERKTMVTNGTVF